MEKVQCIYIICFILQVISIPFTGYLLFPITHTIGYQHLYCNIKRENTTESFRNEFKKLFPNEYTCRDSSLEGFGFFIISLLICMILFNILCTYICIFICKMNKNGSSNDSAFICIFIGCLISLIPIILFYISLIPPKSSFDNPDIIYIFNEQLNKEIEERVEAIVKRKTYSILGFIPITIIIITTIIKIIILYKAKKNSNIDGGKLLINNSNNQILYK